MGLLVRICECLFPFYSCASFSHPLPSLSSSFILFIYLFFFIPYRNYLHPSTGGPHALFSLLYSIFLFPCLQLLIHLLLMYILHSLFFLRPSETRLKFSFLKFSSQCPCLFFSMFIHSSHLSDSSHLPVPYSCILFPLSAPLLPIASPPICLAARHPFLLLSLFWICDPHPRTAEKEDLVYCENSDMYTREA